MVLTKYIAWLFSFIFLYWCVKVVDAIEDYRCERETFVISRNEVIHRKWKAISAKSIQMP